MASIDQKIIHFIKYHNAFSIIFVVVFVGASVSFAAVPEAREAIYDRQEREIGIDNEMLLSSDIKNWDFQPQVLDIEQDDIYYYVKYKFRTLGIKDNIWQEVWEEELLKFEKESDRYVDVQEYIIKEMGEVIQHQVKLLKDSKKIAQSQGRTQKMRVVEYSGIVGRVLDLKPKVVALKSPVAQDRIVLRNSVPAGQSEVQEGAGESDRDLIAKVVEGVLIKKGIIAASSSVSFSGSDVNQEPSGASNTSGGTGQQQATSSASPAPTLSSATTTTTATTTPPEEIAATTTPPAETASTTPETEPDNSTSTSTSTSVSTCSPDRPDLCDTQDKCQGINFYWSDGVCSPEAALVCDSQNLILCTDEAECQSAGGYWYNEGCNLEPEPCSPDWQCSEWQGSADTVCSGESFSQIRDCEDLNNCQTDEGKPTEVQQSVGTKDCSGESPPQEQEQEQEQEPEPENQ